MTTVDTAAPRIAWSRILVVVALGIPYMVGAVAAYAVNAWRLSITAVREGYRGNLIPPEHSTAPAPAPRRPVMAVKDRTTTPVRRAA